MVVAESQFEVLCDTIIAGTLFIEFFLYLDNSQSFVSFNNPAECIMCPYRLLSFGFHAEYGHMATWTLGHIIGMFTLYCTNGQRPTFKGNVLLGIYLK